MPNVSICEDMPQPDHVHYNPYVEKQPNDEIWYTTTDGELVALYSDGKCYGDEECTQELTILSHTYENGKGIIKFDSNVVSIGHKSGDEGLFEECDNLLTCILPNSCKILGEYGFYYCTSLTSINIPDSVTSIGNYAFNSCSGLVSVTIPDSVTSIDAQVFSYCTSLSTVTIGSGVTSIGERAFNGCTSLSTVTIGSGVTSIGNYAFQGCASLSSITCDAVTVPEISPFTFHGVGRYGTLTYPEGSDYSSWLLTGAYYLGYYEWNTNS